MNWNQAKSIADTKSILRQQCLKKLAQTDAHTKLQAGINVAKALFPLILSHLPKNTHLPKNKGVGLFKSFSDEINTTPLCQLLKENHIRCFFPFMHPDCSMYFWEKDSKTPIDNKEIAILIVPGLAFDRLGNRLGRGKGCYDRFLANHSNELILTIGIGMDFQLVDKIPIDSNDQSINMVLTPSFEIDT